MKNKNEKTDDEDEREFIPRVMLKTELAREYNRDVSDRQARRRLTDWMAVNKHIRKELQDCGYSKCQKYFTPHQVEIITKYLGKP